MGRVCVGRLCYGPSLQWAEFAMGRDIQLPFLAITLRTCYYFLNRNQRECSNADEGYTFYPYLSTCDFAWRRPSKEEYI